MFRFNTIIKTFATAFSLLVIQSCLEVEDPQGDVVGYLTFPSIDVDVTVEDLTQTKAIDLDIVAPEVSAMHFVVKDKDGNVQYDAKGLWEAPLVLPVGSYTVEAYAGENGFGAPYFKGSATGSISALDTEVPVLPVALANSLVNVNVSDALAAHFKKGDKISLNNGAYEAEYGQWFYVPSGADLILSLAGKNSADKTATLSYTLQSPSPKFAYMITCGTETTDWPAVSLSLDEGDVWASRIYITEPASFSGNISAENQAAVVYEAIPAASSDWTSSVTAVSENGVMVIKGLVPGTEYQVRARVGALVSPVVKVTPKIDGLSVTAAHTSTNGELDGTDVTSTFSKSAAVTNAIEKWKLDICKADGTVLRSENALGTSDGSAITSTKGWPYLPEGSYKVAVKVVMTDGEEVALEVPFNAVHPVFTLTPMCKTTYNYYLDGDNANANAVQGSTTAEATSPAHSLFAIGSTVGISENLLNNTNYENSLYYAALKGDDVVIDASYSITSKNHTVGNVYDLFTDKRAYKLSVKMTFAGTEITAFRDFHITGLPYTSPNFMSTSVTMKSSSNATMMDWVSNGSVQQSDRGYRILYFYLGGVDAGNLFSPAFYVPEEFSVTYSTPVCYFTGGLGNPNVTVYTGVTNSYTKVKTASTDVRRINSNMYPGISSFTTITKSETMVNNGRISISTDEQKDGNGAQCWFTVASLNVLYSF